MIFSAPRYDNGFAAYLNGVGGRIACTVRPAMVLMRIRTCSDADALQFEDFDLSDHRTFGRRNQHPGHSSAEQFQRQHRPLLVAELRAGFPTCWLLSARRPGWPDTNADPTAKWENEGVFGFVADTSFSVDRGFFDTPQQVEITTGTPGKTATPLTALAHGHHRPLYGGPIPVTTTTTLRAAAFKTGFIPTNVETTYIFLDDVIQPAHPPVGRPTPPAGAAYARLRDGSRCRPL
jgi:hypothetical protein